MNTGVQPRDTHFSSPPDTMTPGLKSSFFAALLLIGTVASATEPERLDKVTVQLQKDPAILPYGRINELLGLLQRHGQGLFRLEFQLMPADPAKPLGKVQMALQHADRYIPIVPNADQVFELPILPQGQAREADLATNQPKGSLGMRATLRLTTPPEQLDMAQVRRIMRTAHTVRSEVLPWYLRMLFPQVLGVRVCSDQAQWELEWPDKGQLLAVPLSADAKDRDPDTVKGEPGRFCTTLSGQEQWPDAARLVAPAGSRLSMRASTAR
nr:hypothetical protein [uncultured Roseateles sp.]